MNIDTVILSNHMAGFKRSHRNKFLLPVVIYFIQDLSDSLYNKLEYNKYNKLVGK